MDGAYSCLALHMYYKCFGSKYKLSFSPVKSGSYLNKCLLTEDILNYDKIFILDKSLSKEEYEFFFNILSMKKIKIVHIDHHLSIEPEIREIAGKLYKSQEEFKKQFKVVYDQGKSSCGITFNYFCNKLNKKSITTSELTNDTNLKNIFAYIEDSDTYQRILPKSNEFKSGILNQYCLLLTKLISDFGTIKL